MLLAIDVGNTNTVLGLFAGDQLVSSWRTKTDSRETADELALKFKAILSDAPDITGIALCSTVPAVLREMRTMLNNYYQDVPQVIVEPGIKTGVPVLTDNPKEVGADRIVNSLAAFTLYGSAKGEFLGGALAPGIEISIDALAARAAQLRKVELIAPRNVIGKNTVEALQSGAVYGFAGQVDGLVDRIVDELGTPVKAVIATGGLSAIVVPESETITHHEPDLTLIGLRLMFERNA